MEAALEQGVLAGWVREERDAHGIPGIAAALWQDGEAVLAAAGGATVETPFRIASITKPFTATLATLVAAEGALDLNAPPRGARTAATVRQLLSHAGGLACEWPRPLAGYGGDDGALARLAADEPERLPLAPGDLYSYSNAGYWLAGAAVAGAAGTTYEQAIAERVLEPLGLRTTGFEEPPGAARGHVPASPGAPEHRPIAAEPYPRPRRPSGGLWSTVADLVRFAELHVADARLASMHAPLIDAPGGAYGLGWMLRRVAGRHVVEHTGSVGGYQSLLLLVPDERLALAVLTDSARGSAAIGGVLRRLALAPEVPPVRDVPDAELRPLAGRYRIQSVDAAVTVEAGGLRVALAETDPVSGERLEQPPQLARALGPREFAVVDGEGAGERIDFPRPGLGRFAGVVALREDA